MMNDFACFVFGIHERNDTFSTQFIDENNGFMFYQFENFEILIHSPGSGSTIMQVLISLTFE